MLPQVLEKTALAMLCEKNELGCFQQVDAVASVHVALTGSWHRLSDICDFHVLWNFVRLDTETWGVGLDSKRAILPIFPHYHKGNASPKYGNKYCLTLRRQVATLAQMAQLCQC